MEKVWSIWNSIKKGWNKVTTETRYIWKQMFPTTREIPYRSFIRFYKRENLYFIDKAWIILGYIDPSSDWVKCYMNFWDWSYDEDNAESSSRIYRGDEEMDIENIGLISRTGLLKGNLDLTRPNLLYRNVYCRDLDYLNFLNYAFLPEKVEVLWGNNFAQERLISPFMIQITEFRNKRRTENSEIRREHLYLDPYVDLFLDNINGRQL